MEKTYRGNLLMLAFPAGKFFYGCRAEITTLRIEFIQILFEKPRSIILTGLVKYMGRRIACGCRLAVSVLLLPPYVWECMSFISKVGLSDSYLMWVTLFPKPDYVLLVARSEETAFWGWWQEPSEAHGRHLESFSSRMSMPYAWK